MRFTLLLLLSATVICADPTWKMGTVADNSTLHPPPDQPPAYTPNGRPVNQVPSLDHMLPQGAYFLIVDTDSAFLVHPSLPTGHPFLRHPKLRPDLVPGDEIMYSIAGNTLRIIDAHGNLRQTAIVRQVPLK